MRSRRDERRVSTGGELLRRVGVRPGREGRRAGPPRLGVKAATGDPADGDYDFEEV